MTDVKIYTITSDDLSPPIKGEGFCTDMVRHSDYAALEAERDQLAAENADLKKPEVPMGAIENGRAFAARLESYPFECEGGNLNMCSDWQELLRCFEHLSGWAMHSQAETPATDAWQREQMAKGVDAAIAHAFKDSVPNNRMQFIARMTDFAAKLRNGEAV